MSDPVALTVPQAAKRLGVSDWLLYDLIKKHKFPPARRVGRRIVIPVRALERWIEDPDGPTTAAS